MFEGFMLDRCVDAVKYIKEAMELGRINGELKNHIEILLERNAFLEHDLSRVLSEMLAEKDLALKREEARAKAREAQLQAEKKESDMFHQLNDLKQWKKVRKGYEPDEATGLQRRKNTGGYYCPKCLSAEPPVEQPVPPAPEYDRTVKCPVCGCELPNRDWRDTSGPAGTSF